MQTIELQSLTPTIHIKASVPPIPFPQRLRRKPKEEEVQAITTRSRPVSDRLRLKANDLGTTLTPLVPISQRLQKVKLEEQAMKFLEGNVDYKKEDAGHETIALVCSAIIQHRIPPKFKDSGSFTLPCSIGYLNDINYLIDLGASINLIPPYLYRKLGLGDPKAASIILQLADRSLKHSYGIVEDMLIKAGEFIFQPITLMA
ncbi:uncharacterized protein LOC111391401 [Olea europaea var. sylvestris]|uniref:uncharacterized protein LOC111391401 n=1 Tax=Olea europaea var. sylvestris TaxID=158386 RepID=UPI000C1D0F3B|nr:uncharacterized protein LOC111391401 [Olea europaea var. sylvestris]